MIMTRFPNGPTKRKKNKLNGIFFIFGLVVSTLDIPIYVNYIGFITKIIGICTRSMKYNMTSWFFFQAEHV